MWKESWFREEVMVRWRCRKTSIFLFLLLCVAFFFMLNDSYVDAVIVAVSVVIVLYCICSPC